MLFFIILLFFVYYVGYEYGKIDFKKRNFIIIIIIIIYNMNFIEKCVFYSWIMITMSSVLLLLLCIILQNNNNYIITYCTIIGIAGISISILCCMTSTIIKHILFEDGDDDDEDDLNITDKLKDFIHTIYMMCFRKKNTVCVVSSVYIIPENEIIQTENIIPTAVEVFIV